MEEFVTPYMDFREVTELDENRWDTFIVNLNESDRIRIYSTQLMNEVLDNITLHNYLYHVSIYYKLGYTLIERFPNREEEINNISILFWQEVQKKLKKLNRYK